MMNTSLLIFESKERKATVTSPDIDNRYSKGVILTLDVTAVTSGASIVLSVDYKDEASGKYVSYFTGTAAVTTVSTNAYMIYPGVGAASGGITETSPAGLPKTWRVKVTHADDKAITYSVGANLMI